MRQYENNGPERPNTPFPYVDGTGFLPSDPAREERRALIACANSAGLCILLYFFLRSSLLTYLVRFFLLFFPDIRYFNEHLMAPDWLTQVIYALTTLLGTAAPFLLYALLVRIPVRAAFPLRRPAVSVAVPAVLVSLGVAMLGTLATSVLGRLLRALHVIPIQPSIAFPHSGVGLFLLFINLCVLPAFVEEFLYRGVLMQSLRRFGDSFALIVSAILFSLLHLNLAQIPSALLMGLVIGYFVLHTGSLWTGVLIHFFNNLLAFAQQYALHRLAARDVSLIFTAVALLCLLLGLISAVLLARGQDDMFRLKPTASAYTLRGRLRLFFASPAILVMLVFSITFTLHSIQILP